MSESIISQGLQLMLFGMGTVFVFLTMMVIATTVMSAIIQRLSPPEATSPPRVASPDAAKSSSDSTLVAVISAAIHQHRNRK